MIVSRGRGQMLVEMKSGRLGDVNASLISDQNGEAPGESSLADAETGGRGDVYYKSSVFRSSITVVIKSE